MRARARFRDFDGTCRTVSRWGATSAEAESLLVAAIEERAVFPAGDWTGGTRLAAAIDLWRADLEAGSLAAATRQLYEAAARLYVRPALGEVRLGELTPAVIDRALTMVRATKGTQPARAARRALSSWCADAVRHDAIGHHPVHDSRPIACNLLQALALTPAEAADLQARLAGDPRAVRLDLPDLVQFMLGTGGTAWHPTRALYPGNYLDLSPSTAIPSVTYVDTDRRAARYFADEAFVAAELHGRTLAACDQATWTGRRDHALLLLAAQTGPRVSELAGLTRADVHLGTGAHVACHGKGRKDRITPLTTSTVAVLRHWLREQPTSPEAPLFPTRQGGRLSRDAIEHRIARYATKAAADCPALHGKTITAHVLRHTTAMRLLHAGIDTSVIALWLGHVSVETTQIYLHADLELKEKALARTRPPNTPTGRYQPTDTLLTWLEAL